ncbi:MBL fold metallo-hydrolase [Anaerobacillus alkaliphilus]|uniref:MBL fold metallo-hydrolase n=1 Tax=Anaerobacillus alkaliphilus TaxID=1548597 RepID=A0A4Q0VTM3_9BACI|nr:MBL fold metallo-hydrolase [Anaerobacillus alkaliphilus]RXJ00325.1 MBL fold metallo-hydrolase [Anaerobacillus alkaliphilus]
MISQAKTIEKIILPTPFLVGPVNIYIIKGDLVTLVDTGPNTVEAKEELERSLKSLGYLPSDVDQIILTHHHPDHVGLVESLFPHAKVIGHEKSDKWLRKDPEFISFIEGYFYSFFKEHSVPVELIDKMVKANQYFLSFTGTRGLDEYVKEGDTINGLSGWKVIETPGHAQSHISLYHEEDRILIGGDHIIAHISSNAILEPPYSEEESRPLTLVQYRNALQKCLDLHVDIVYSGHGKPVEDLQGLLQGRFEEQEEKARRLRNMIPEEGITSFELCKQYFPHVYQKEPTLTMSEIIGHLDLLQSRGELATVKKNGFIFYHKI